MGITAIMPAMPWRLYRYMLGDVLRQFAITAAVLVVVIAFGAAVKPLANDSLLSPLDIARYVGLAIVPMLQFALPFAAAFAATLSLHRMSQDNEIIAMAAAGNSYVRILAPVVALGVALTITLAVLTQWIVPQFVGMMGQAVTHDLPRLLARSIQQHTPFVQGDLVIWAEDIIVVPGGENGGERLGLEKVAVAKLDKAGQPIMDLTASAAVVDVRRADGVTTVFVETKNAVSWERESDGSGMLHGAERGQLTDPVSLPSLTQGRPSSLTQPQLIDLYEHPLEYAQVARAANRLADALRHDLLWTRMNEVLQSGQPLILRAASGGRTFDVSAGGIAGGRLLGSVHVTMRHKTLDARSLQPRRANLLAEASTRGRVEAVTLFMKDVRVEGAEGGDNRRDEITRPDLVPENIGELPRVPREVDRLLEMAEPSEDPEVVASVKSVQSALISMHHQITSRIAQRYALSLSGIFIVLLGGIFAIRLRERPPLATYLLAFLPAVIDLLLVFAGGQMVRDGSVVSGFIVMWSGNAALSALVLYQWWRLRTN
jgi:lipopolysaccharide export LptBFGC system permease protein LptF